MEGESDRAETADLHRDTVPRSRCWVSRGGTLQSRTEAHFILRPKIPTWLSCKKNIHTLPTHTHTHKSMSWSGFLTLSRSFPLHLSFHSHTASCQLRQTDKTRCTSCTDLQNGLYCALMTGPAEMTSDPQTWAVWPLVNWWEWPLGQGRPLEVHPPPRCAFTQTQLLRELLRLHRCRRRWLTAHFWLLIHRLIFKWSILDLWDIFNTTGSYPYLWRAEISLSACPSD